MSYVIIFVIAYHVNRFLSWFDYGHASVRLPCVSWWVVEQFMTLVCLAPPYMYRMARQHCLLQAGKAMTILWSFSSGEKLM